MSTAIQRQLALIAATVILIAAIVGVAADAGEDNTAVVAVPTSTPVETDDAGSTDKPDKTKGPKKTAGPADTTAPDKTSAPDAPSAGGRPSADATPPKVGVYTYEEETDGEKSETTLRISDAGGRRQEEERDEGTQEVEWRDDGKFVTSAQFQGFTCDFEPDVLEIKLPLKTGSSWTFEGACEPFKGVSVRFKGSSTVTGTEERTVGTTKVDTWVISSKGTISTKSPQGSFDTKLTGSDRFDPEHGLSVYSEGTAEGRDPRSGQPMKETRILRLKSLTPR